MRDAVKVLMIGDVVGQPGLKALFAGLGPLLRNYCMERGEGRVAAPFAEVDS